MTAPVHITFLGGLGEIGRNCACIEVDGKILLIDCGILFPDADMPGIDLVLPDFTYLRENADRIVGCVATHGHEDHVGGLSYLLRELEFPIYGSALTLGLARHRIEEAKLLDRTQFIPVEDNERRKIGPFDCEFLPVTHSVPHGFATAIHTPQGTILHTGDWKLDLNPVDGRHTDLSVMGAIAQNEGIRLLLSDSTNADSPGHSRSETSVGAVLYDVMHAHEGRRLIVTCFASHIHRVQQIADAAQAFGRRVATLGLSMKKNVALAREMGVLRIPDHVLIDIEDIDPLPPGEVCVISTGSQGEPMSALARLAAGENRWLTVKEDDTVILSSHPIPGNEFPVGKVIDGLTRLGAKVVHTGIADVHATGHAKAEELKTLISVTRPEWMIPVHGEYRHLAAHAELARQMGVAADNVVVCEDGDRVELSDHGVRKVDPVPANHLFVDGTVGDVGQGVLRDRRVLAEEGVVVVIVGVDAKTGAVVHGPEIVTRGWVYAPEAEELLDGAAAAVRDGIKAAFANEGTIDHETLSRHVRKAAGKYVNEQTKRRPMIVPVVLEA